MSSDLDGATDLGSEQAYPSTPGEFAARWNAMSEERRAGFLNAMRVASDRSALCMVMHQRDDH